MVLKKLRTFLLLPWIDKALVFEAILWLGLMRLAVLTLPFKRVSSLLGQAGASSPEAPLAPSEAQTAIRVARAIRRTQPFTPWDSNCLAQALTARHMLARRGMPSTTYLGATIEGQKGIIAHAWLRCGPWILTGAQGHKRYKVVATFA
ncbi:MAG: lasso peptide biosynthesis B2 protein [Anaerolineae bacterium]|nr:lasso peptide biosynthesis B2 protein [Anaerolineae bacterium]